MRHRIAPRDLKENLSDDQKKYFDGDLMEGKVKRISSQAIKTLSSL